MPDPTTGGTPPFVQDPSQPGNSMASIMQRLLPMLAQMQGAKGGGGGVNPLVSKGMPGQMPQMPGAPQVAGAGAGGVSTAGGMAMPGRMAGPLGPATQNQPASQGPPQSGLMQTGMEFDSPKGRDAAVVTSAIQGVSQFISQAKQKKESKTRAQAENYMSQIHAAQSSGDQETLNLLLQDPKVVSTLEKGLNYLMPKVPGEPPPPEATGVKKFLDKLSGKDPRATNPNGPRLPAPNTPGGVAMPRQPQSAANAQSMQDLVSKAALQALQNDPEMAKRMGLGTGLKGSEATDAERFQAGLKMAPVQEQQAYQAHQDILEKYDHENRQLLAELAGKKDIATAGNVSAERQTQMSAGPIYERAKVAREVGLASAKARELVTKGKVGEANKVVMQTLTSQIDSLRTNATKAAKDDNKALSESYTKEADDLQKKYDAVQESQNVDVDKIIEDILK